MPLQIFYEKAHKINNLFFHFYSNYNPQLSKKSLRCTNFKTEELFENYHPHHPGKQNQLRTTKNFFH